MAFSNNPEAAEINANVKVPVPTATWIGINAERISRPNPGYKNVIKPVASYKQTDRRLEINARVESTWYANKMTVKSPIHEWSVYKLGIGGTAKLCASKTACSPITANKKLNECIAVCNNLSFFFGKLRLLL